jgi:hypothetical protein
MIKDPIRPNETAIGDAAVLARTGRGREEWFTLLDAAGALAWAHAGIARWLVEEHTVDPWWAQSVTVGYEQARGLRAPGQRPDGSFEAGASRTYPLPVEQVLRWLADAEQRDRWLDVVPEVRGTPSVRSVRWGWPDGTRVTIHLLGQPGDRTRVSVQHKGLADAEALPPRKAYWAERLDCLAAQLSP